MEPEVSGSSLVETPTQYVTAASIYTLPGVYFLLGYWELSGANKSQEKIYSPVQKKLTD